MAGRIKKMIDTIITKRACGNQALVTIIKTKLILKGIRAEVYTKDSEDDPVVIDKLIGLAKELGIIT